MLVYLCVQMNTCFPCIRSVIPALIFSFGGLKYFFLRSWLVWWYRSLCADVGFRSGKTCSSSRATWSYASMPWQCHSLCSSKRTVWQANWWISVNTGMYRHINNPEIPLPVEAVIVNKCMIFPHEWKPVCIGAYEVGYFGIGKTGRHVHVVTVIKVL